MILVALIIEQLDHDGMLRTFRLAPADDQKIIVAFADEYKEPRIGPFHFLDPEFSREFERGFAAAQVRRVGSKRFYRKENLIHFGTEFHGIPTKEGCLTYYALSLPEFAIPSSICARDPHSKHEYRKNVTRDDDHKRFVVYLECHSPRGLFDFILETDFRIDSDQFSNANYQDDETDSYGRQIDDYKWFLDEPQLIQVQQFFGKEIIMGDTVKGDSFKALQAGAMGRNPQASHMTFQQIWNQIRSWTSHRGTKGPK